MEVAVGRIAKAHGVRGELAVDLSTDSPEVRFASGTRLTARRRREAPRTLTVSAARTHGTRLLVMFDEVRGRDQAEELRGCLLLADTGDLPPNQDPDEFYDHELEGLTVVTVDGEEIGTVIEVVHGAGGELLAVDAGDREVLVPFVKQIVPAVDLEQARVTIDPPDGLLEVE
ncbi:ribosome maturation factor RimM [Sciscionella marina]|uniref:ribosome maturation factor RimM n=1 Tax=Sciscionella marina TaxID=508770 RepID=UPI0003A0D4D8|nr:ribosome maturation factor RimM [Sciscionella marina]